MTNHHPNSQGYFDDIFAPTRLPTPGFNAAQDCTRLRTAMKGAGANESELIEVLCRRTWQERSELLKTYPQVIQHRDLYADVKSETSRDFKKVLKRLLMSPIDLPTYELYQSMGDCGVDVDILCDIVTTKQSDDLKTIAAKFEKKVGTKLADNIFAEGGNDFFCRLLRSLVESNRPQNGPVDAKKAAEDAKMLHESGGNGNRFIALLCERSFSHLRAVFECYNRDFKRDVIAAIQADFNDGRVAEALSTVVSAIRNAPGHFAKRINEAVSTQNTNEDLLLRIICWRADIDLGAVKQEYQRIYGKDLYSVVEDETKSDFQAALLALLV